ncbi:Hypothetical predicted protein, partial [Paramuricea clavata]
KKKLLYKKAKRSQNESTWIRYRQMNNNLKRKCNEARWRYITDSAQDLTDNNNRKPFRNFVKSKCKGTNKLISLKVGKSVFTDDQGIADSMNSYFSSVFTVGNYDNIPVLDYIVDERLENIRCSVDEVGKLLLNLKVETSPGPDNIPARILKVCATELAPSISYLLNKSFSMGMLPIEWKTANITPIFKKGSKNSRENYRQISLTGIICKIGEKVVRSRVLDFWYRMNILSENQFAYLKGKSTVTQLLSTVDDWVRSRNSGVPTDVTFLDLAKAFDSVPHERLILKLRSY